MGGSSSSVATPAAASCANGAALRHIFAFGDSYTSAYFDPAGTQPSSCAPMGNPAPYGSYLGFDNWLMYLMRQAPANTLAYDIAAGGATVDNNYATYLGGTVDLKTQLATWNSYYATKNFWTGSDTMFLFWFGINDILFDPWYQAPYTPDTISYLTSVDTMYKAGARNFMFLGVPPLQSTPYIQALPNNITNIASDVTLFNTLLQTQIATFKSTHPDAKLTYYDTNNAFSRVLNNPNKYCANNATCMAFPYDQSCLWLNGIHASSALHQEVGRDVYNLAVAQSFWPVATTVAASYPTCTSPVSTAAPTGPLTGGTWKPYGCYTDLVTWNARSLPVKMTIASMTNEACQSSCAAAGYQLAGTEFGVECYCGNQIVNGGSLLSSDTNGASCNMPCAGATTETCGGSSKLSVWQLVGSGALSSSSSSSVSTSTSTSSSTSSPSSSSMSSSISTSSSTSSSTTKSSSTASSTTSSSTQLSTLSTSIISTPKPSTTSTTSKTSTSTSATTSSTAGFIGRPS